MLPGWPLGVSVRRDRAGLETPAFLAARELADRGHAFVLAPARGRSGTIVHRLGARPVVVSEFVDGTTDFPEGLTPSEQGWLLAMLDELHQAEITTPVPGETFALVFADEFDPAGAHALAGAAAAGPFGSAVSDLVQASACATRPATPRVQRRP